MISTSNLAMLKVLSSAVIEEINEFEGEYKSIFTDKSRDGKVIVGMLNGDEKYYLCSKYSPEREAEALIENYPDLEDKEFIIFYGIGSGYQIEALAKKYPKKVFYIYEENIELVHYFLSNFELKDFVLNIKGIATKFDFFKKDLRVLISQNDNPLLFYTDVYTNYDKDAFIDFKDKFKVSMEFFVSLRIAEKTFEKGFILAQFKNMKYILNDVNSGSLRGRVSNSIAYLVAAGPSLDLELENLKRIKKEKLGYIFAVGSTFQTLLKNDIVPDAICTYDMSDKNYRLFKPLLDEGYDKSAMFYGQSTAYGIPDEYKGTRISMFDLSCTFSNSFLKSKESSFPFYKVGFTISVITLDMLCVIGFKKIVLLGQNLASLDGKAYSKFNKYSTSIRVDSKYTTKNVYGEETETSLLFNTMREQIEKIVAMHPESEIINCTKGGAQINGTEFMELDNFLKENTDIDLKDDNWLDLPKPEYDREYMENALEAKEKALVKIKPVLNGMDTELEILKDRIDLKKTSLMQKSYEKLDKSFTKLEENEFSKIVLSSIGTTYDDFVNKIPQINDMTDAFEKGKVIHTQYEDFLRLYKVALDFYKKEFEEIKDIINEYLEKNQNVQG